MRTLCVDIGGTRIKWAVLRHRGGLIEDWRPLVQSMRSIGWLNASLPELLDTASWAGLLSPDRSPEPFDAVGVAITGVVSASGDRLSGWLLERGVPAALRAHFARQVAPRPVRIWNDAVACLRGALRFLGPRPDAPPPYLLLTFGTGVGTAVGTSIADVTGVEYDAPFRGRHLAAAATWDELIHPWDVHRILGHRFFGWVNAERARSTYYEVRTQFTDCVAALVRDHQELRGRIGTVLVAGGNAEYVSVRRLAERVGTRVLPLRAPELKIPPDVISLAGCVD